MRARWSHRHAPCQVALPGGAGLPREGRRRRARRAHERRRGPARHRRQALKRADTPAARYRREGVPFVGGLLPGSARDVRTPRRAPGPARHGGDGEFHDRGRGGRSGDGVRRGGGRRGLTPADPPAAVDTFKPRRREVVPLERARTRGRDRGYRSPYRGSGSSRGADRVARERFRRRLDARRADGRATRARAGKTFPRRGRLAPDFLALSAPPLRTVRAAQPTGPRSGRARIHGA